MSNYQDVRERFEAAAREFVKQIWVKRDPDPRGEADLARIIPNYVPRTEASYPAAFTHFVEVEIDGTPKIFRFNVKLLEARLSYHDNKEPTK